MPDRVTTPIPSGVTNALIGTALETYIGMDPSTVHQYFNDFDVYAAADWTITNTSTHATNGLVAGNGGILSMANSSTSADLDQLTLTVATFAFTPGLQAWFKARFQVSNATNSGLAIGLQELNTTAFAATDGVWFQKSEASTTLNALVAASSTTTTSSWSLTMANTTYVDVGFYYDGGLSGVLQLYANGNPVGSVVTTNLPASSTNLALTIALENGTAAANTLLVDYVMVGVERESPSQILGS